MLYTLRHHKAYPEGDRNEHSDAVLLPLFIMTSAITAAHGQGYLSFAMGDGAILLLYLDKEGGKPPEQNTRKGGSGTIHGHYSHRNAPFDRFELAESGTIIFFAEETPQNNSLLFDETRKVSRVMDTEAGSTEHIEIGDGGHIIFVCPGESLEKNTVSDYQLQPQLLSMDVTA